MLKLYKQDFLFIFLIFIISVFFISGLFMFSSRPATFDSNIHISNIAQFAEILKSGEFPVVWMNNFANYGIPMGIFTHQLTNYSGGVLTILTNNPVLSYNLLFFTGAFLSNILVYLFLRIYFLPLASFLGAFIFCLTPYRIFNVYVRGAMPEFFSGIFLSLILISLYLFIVRKSAFGLFLLIISIVGLVLNHPMMLIVYSLLFLPYLFFLLISSGLSIVSRIKIFFTVIFSTVLGLLICSYYIFPLNLEIKYFYYGLTENHIASNSYLSLLNIPDFRWYYFTKSEIFTRGHTVVFGLIESIILILGLLYLAKKILTRKIEKNHQILIFAVATAFLLMFFTTKYSDVFFENISFLNSIQFSWRFLSALIFLPPIVVAYFYEKFPNKIIFIVIILVVAYLSFPQLYGKNYSNYQIESYYFSKENVHSVLMNPIWTEKSENYPDKNTQGEIIEGAGEIISQEINNSSRIYQVNAKTPLKLVDRTFYFPGWNVYVDGMKTNIEFQDPDYRGVITYPVPIGEHNISVVFEDTKVRFIGKILSVLSLTIFFFILFFRKKISKIFK